MHTLRNLILSHFVLWSLGAASTVGKRNFYSLTDTNAVSGGNADGHSTSLNEILTMSVDRLSVEVVDLEGYERLGNKTLLLTDKELKVKEWNKPEDQNQLEEKEMLKIKRVSGDDRMKNFWNEEWKIVQEKLRKLEEEKKQLDEEYIKFQLSLNQHQNPEELTQRAERKSATNEIKLLKELRKLLLEEIEFAKERKEDEKKRVEEDQKKRSGVPIGEALYEAFRRFYTPDTQLEDSDIYNPLVYLKFVNEIGYLLSERENLIKTWKKKLSEFPETDDQLTPQEKEEKGELQKNIEKEEKRLDEIEKKLIALEDQLTDEMLME